MLKKILVTFVFAFVFISMFSFNTFASVDSELENDDFIDEESIVENVDDFDELDYVIQNYTDSNEILELYHENEDFYEEEGNNRDLYFGQIYGFIRWTDDENVTHALEGASVTLVGFGNYVSTTTDYTGFYSLNFSIDSLPPLISFQITIYSGNTNVKVFDANNSAYKKQDMIYLNSYLSDVYNYTFNNTIDGDVSRAMQILSAMQNYYNYASILTNEAIPPCKVVYPYFELDGDGNPIPLQTGSFYLNGEDTIYLSNDCETTGSPYSYSSWDVIGHEYGHHLEYYYFRQNFFGDHYVDTSEYYSLVCLNYNDYPIPLSDENKINLKKNGCGLGMKEAWATFFSITAQKSFSADIKSVPKVNNTYYESYDGVNCDISALYTGGGESCELVISGILYNLYDSNNTEEWDNITIDDNDLFNLMDSDEPENLSAFLNCLMNSNLNVPISDISKMLSAYHVSPYELSINAYPNSSSGMGYKWYRGNCNLEYNNYKCSLNNNYFTLEFYDENNNLLLNKVVPSVNPFSISLEETCVLTLSEWNMVLQCTTSKYYVVIVGYSTNYYSTGSFISERYYFKIPTEYNINLINSNYYEKQFTINQGEEWLFNIKFDHSGYELIQSFGSNDIVMSIYNDNNVLLSESDDEGYGNNSLIYYYFNSNEIYHLYVCYFSPSNSGIEKISIVPCSGEFINSINAVYDFYDINLLNNQNNIIYQTVLPQYESKVILWTPSISGIYAICLVSQFDNMLYVVNPASNSLLIDEVDYCDDYCIDSDQDLYDPNAELRNYYYSNMTYFIVVSKFNSSLSSDNITLVITKIG